jgi:hypothetical protein
LPSLKAEIKPNDCGQQNSRAHRLFAGKTTGDKAKSAPKHTCIALILSFQILTETVRALKMELPADDRLPTPPSTHNVGFYHMSSLLTPTTSLIALQQSLSWPISM